MPAKGKPTDPLKRIQRKNRLLQQKLHMYDSLMAGIRENLDIDEFLQRLIREITKGLQFDRAGIFLVEPEQKHIRLAMGVDAEGRFEKDTFAAPLDPRPGTNAFSDMAYGYHKWFLTNKAQKRLHDKKELVKGVESNAVVCMDIGAPLSVGLIAVDTLWTRRKIHRTEVLVLQDYASHVGLALNSFLSLRKAKDEGMRDEVTHLPNRRAVWLSLQELVKTKANFIVLFIDLDKFKLINDTLGHHEGDVVLRLFAAQLQIVSRSSDLVARMGGDEFIVLMRAEDSQGVNAIVKRIRDEWTRHPLPEKYVKLGLNFSVGHARYPHDGETPEALLEIADKRMYQDKGRKSH